MISSYANGRVPATSMVTTDENEIFVLAARPAEIGDSTWPHLLALLDDGERQRAARFVFDRDRQAFVAAHALKRLMFAIETGAPAPSWRFETAPGGKPHASPQQDMAPFFNLSHCDGLVACALSRTTALGVDVECSDRPAPSAVAERHYSPEERAWLVALPESERQTGFFMLWTLKEAFIKATGKGLAQPLRDIVFRFDPLSVHFSDALSSACGDPNDWRFEQRRLSEKHLFALAWRGPAHVIFRSVRLDWLLAQSLKNASSLAAIIAE